MNFQELRQFADKLNINRTETPLNALKLARQLNIPIKDENASRVDFRGANNPLWEYPAFLFIDCNGNKTIYFNSVIRYWNFYLMHEIAHYLLNHKGKSYHNEIEADLLACLLLVPMEFVMEKVENAYKLWKLCNIPPDKADMYWSEIYEMKYGSKSGIYK